jgi:hypothetical protein
MHKLFGGLCYDAVGIYRHRFGGKLIGNDLEGSRWCPFEVQFRHLCVGTDQNHDNYQDIWRPAQDLKRVSSEYNS